MAEANLERAPSPDMKISVRQVFGIDSDLEVPAYSEPEEHVPDTDPDYLFDRETTLAILAGFARNRRVLISGSPQCWRRHQVHLYLRHLGRPP